MTAEEAICVTSNSKHFATNDKGIYNTMSARCVRDNLAEIRGNANPKYAGKIDNGEMERKFVNFYNNKFSHNHTPKSFLTEREKVTIVNTINNMVIKDEK